MHTFLFFVLVILLHRATDRQGRDRGRLHSILGSAGILVIVLEIAQLWVPHRTFELLDILAGMAGALVARVVIAAKSR